jgi:hypothetical protein
MRRERFAFGHDRQIGRSRNRIRRRKALSRPAKPAPRIAMRGLSFIARELGTLAGEQHPQLAASGDLCFPQLLRAILLAMSQRATEE